MSLFPVMLHAEAIEALVVGGGAVAARRALALLDAGARVRVVAPRLDAVLRDAATREARLELVERAYRPGDERGATLVVAATGDRAVNALVAARAREERCLVNVADAPEEGTFSAAAVHRAGDLVIAVSAGGVPAAAARVRDAIAERFDDRYARAVADLRGLRARLRDAGDGARWREVSDALVGDEFVARVEDGTLTERVRQWA